MNDNEKWISMDKMKQVTLDPKYFVQKNINKYRTKKITKDINWWCTIYVSIYSKNYGIQSELTTKKRKKFSARNDATTQNELLSEIMLSDEDTNINEPPKKKLKLQPLQQQNIIPNNPQQNMIPNNPQQNMTPNNIQQNMIPNNIIQPNIIPNNIMQPNMIPNVNPYHYQPKMYPYPYQPNMYPFQYHPNMYPQQYNPNIHPYQYQTNINPYQYNPNINPYQYNPNINPTSNDKVLNTKNIDSNALTFDRLKKFLDAPSKDIDYLLQNKILNKNNKNTRTGYSNQILRYKKIIKYMDDNGIYITKDEQYCTIKEYFNAKSGKIKIGVNKITVKLGEGFVLPKSNDLFEF